MSKKIVLLFFLILNAFSSQIIWANEKIVYQGHIYNIFFHPLIKYPDLAFNPKNKNLVHMDNWFVTVKEFKKILPELYKRGFVLVSPKDIFQESKDNQGRIIITRKKLILPAGKKPLILSLDDYNFYNSMKLNGTIHRFEVNKYGKLVTITRRNKTTITDDQEIPQILEKFIKKHPDFAFKNARGIIALTGYNGIFGYNTHKTSSNNYRSELAEAKKVIHKLKRMGWQFASHSYFHLSEKQLAGKKFKVSERRWLKEVGSIVGPTSYYIFPFGDSWNENLARMKFLKLIGYKYFFGVATTTNLTILPDAVVMDRFPMDGRSLREKYIGSKIFVNPDDVWDSSRVTKIK